MKIITVTSQKAYNYGAVLQTYALHKTMISLGYENLLLDHEIKNDAKRKKSLKVFLRDFILACANIIHKRELERFKENFRNFLNENIASTKLYHSIEDIMNEPPVADIYLTGSDQVFALGNQLVPVRYLEFGEPKTPRVSYAASLGSYVMNDKELAYIKERLSSFSKISIREKCGSEYLKSMIGIESMVHIDPVFLLSVAQWEALLPTHNRIDGKYILIFPMLNNKNLQRVLEHVKKEVDLPVISIQTKFIKTVKADQYLFDVSVPEFLSMIRNAAVVISTSFHATAFSIIFKRPFYSLVGKYKPERAQNLGELFNLHSRVISEDETVFPAIETDFCCVDDVLEKERARSMAFLSSLQELL